MESSAGLYSLIDFRIAADPDSQLARPRAFRTAADRRVQYVYPARGELGMNLAYQFRRASAEIEIDLARRQPLVKAVPRRAPPPRPPPDRAGK